MPFRPFALLSGLTLAILLFAGRPARGQVPPLDRGNEALVRHDIVAAERAFRSAAESPVRAERAAGLRALALLSWRVRRNDAAASALLDSALATGADTTATLIEASRFELARRRWIPALALAKRARAATNGEEERRAALRALLAAYVEPQIERSAGRTSSAAAPDSALAAAVREFVELTRAYVGRSDDAELLLHGALIAGDGATALDAWESYYRLELPGTVDGPLARPGRALREVLPRLKDGLSSADRDQLVRALADSRLFDAAALAAGGEPPASPRAREVVAYAGFTRRLARAVDEHYRTMLLGSARTDQLRRIHTRHMRELWPRLAWPDGNAPRFYPAGAIAELERRFGALVHFGRTAGYYDLHYGHIVSDERHVVRQYGRRATLRFVVLDGMVSNGFETWAWDGRSTHAGWQTGDLIVQVRTAFTENPLAMWRFVADSQAARVEAATIGADSAADWVRAAADSAGYLPGASRRLVRDGRTALVDSLRRAGHDGPALQRAFVRAWSEITRAAAILAHEGRHAIDRNVGVFSDEAMEFRAKLSEVAFSSNPKIVMVPILHPDIGAPTPHGRANRRVMLGLIAWMRDHASEITGLDTSRPLLPQLPLLTDEQLRRAFRSLDDLAR